VRGTCKAALQAFAVAALLGSGLASADDELPTLTIGYLDLIDDIRYDEWGIHPVDIRSATAIADRRAYSGAALGLEELKSLNRITKTHFAMERVSGTGSADLIAAVERMVESGSRYFLIDAPDDVVAEVAAGTRDHGIALFNTTATGDALRSELCQPHLFHTAASRTMLSDALSQYLVARKWHEILVLQGPLPQDKETVAAFERSSVLFGLEIIAIRDFVLGNDPRARELNDLDFLTGGLGSNYDFLSSGDDYDVVFVADADGEFALGVPYATQEPAPVVGASGLVPRIWHWSYMRHGAPQVHGRFERKFGRRMGESDWGAWVAMKTIGNAIARTKSTDVAAIVETLRGGTFKVDGSKGPGMSFRPWNNQLRQPILLTRENWTVARAPLEGFKTRTNKLDSLGVAARGSLCNF
jgi:ABC transporter substrate binding protein (PQQ-dependent alcohol dehydrogenase system)